MEVLLEGLLHKKKVGAGRRDAAAATVSKWKARWCQVAEAPAGPRGGPPERWLLYRQAAAAATTPQRTGSEAGASGAEGRIALDSQTEVWHEHAVSGHAADSYFTIAVGRPGDKLYFFSCESQESMDEWMGWLLPEGRGCRAAGSPATTPDALPCKAPLPKQTPPSRAVRAAQVRVEIPEPIEDSSPPPRHMSRDKACDQPFISYQRTGDVDRLARELTGRLQVGWPHSCQFHSSPAAHSEFLRCS